MIILNQLDRYINTVYDNSDEWFVEEVQQPHHMVRIAKVLQLKNYLKGNHKILDKEDFTHKGKTFKTSKMILQTIKTICNFHATFLFGYPITITGDREIVKEYEKIYKKGRYTTTDFKLYDNIIKFGDAYEYIYYDNDNVKSKVIDSIDGYPVYDINNNYVAFIEHYVIGEISTYIVYTEDKVLTYSNEGDGKPKLLETHLNVSGLPIHYRTNSLDQLFGESLIDDIKPIMDKIEALLNKMDDSITTMSLNPIPYITGQRLDTPINADTVGYLLNLEDGSEFEYAVAQLDAESIKVLYNALLSHLWIVAKVPSVVMGQSNIANVSEVSLKLLYTLSGNYARENGLFFKDCLLDRFEKIGKISGLDSDEVDMEFNVARPTDESEVINNLSKQYADGVISKVTYLSKSPTISNVFQELENLEREQIEDEKKFNLENGSNMEQNEDNKSNDIENGNV